MTEIVPLVEGERLLHIGPFKTGTTTLQAAFHQSRPALAEQGIHYAGKNAHPMSAAMMAAGGRILPTRDVDVATSSWTRLLEDVHAAQARHTVISSEFFCEADSAHIRAIVDDLGPPGTHVVVTLRPLVRILASQWQQYLQNRLVADYDRWLHGILDDPAQLPPPVSPSFWNRHCHDEVVRRWVEVVGEDHLTVVVVDESDPRMLLSTFEQLIDVTEGTLVARDLGSNRSLTWSEAEMLRTFNLGYRQREGSEADYTRLIRFGAARYLQERRPGPDERRVPLPPWAADRAAGLGAEAARRIRDTGVRVIGDLDSLGDPGLAQNVSEILPSAGVEADTAARFTAGLVRHLLEIPAEPAPPGRTPGPIETEMRGRRQASANADAATRLEAKLARAQAQLDQPWRVEDLSRLALLRTALGRALDRLGRSRKGRS